MSDFLRAVSDAVGKFKALPLRRVVLLHHNDSDGLCSGAILLKTFERLGLHVHRHCLEKPYPEVLKLLLNDDSWGRDTAFVITDFASGALDYLTSFNRGRYPLFLLDHHGLVGTPDTSMTIVSPRLFGFSSRAASASIVCALFALACSPNNEDLAPLGVIGAVGDGFLSPTQSLDFPSSVVLEKALSSGLISRVEESLTINWKPPLKISRVVQYLDALGSWGYFDGGPDIAIKCLVDEFRAPSSIVAEEALVAFEQGVARAVSEIHLTRRGKLAWFILPESFRSLGVKTVGLICERIVQEEVARGVNGVPPIEYLVGFQPLSSQIPGLGPVVTEGTKVSMRLGSALRPEVEGGSRPGIDILLPKAATTLGGFVDACHPHAGAATVAIGREVALIEELDRVLQSV